MVEILKVWTNAEEGTEVRLVVQHDGSFGVHLFDTDADAHVGGHIGYATREAAEAYASTLVGGRS